MSNEIQILDLSWRSRSSGGGQLTENGFWRYPSVPYLLVNCVFRCDPGYYRDKALGRAQDYRQVLVTGSPEEEEAAFQAELEEQMVERESKEGFDVLADWVNRVNRSEPKPKVWTYDDPLWHHIEKFNVFWFREWVSDCTVTRAALQELRLYQTEGSVKSIYRTTDEEIVLKHLETIQSYWD
jgi:hypothetical protein